IRRMKENAMMNIGFIGLGTMGRPMAMHLLRAGHDVGVYARRPEVAAAMQKQGAKAFASPQDLAARSEVVFTMVTSSADVEAVSLGPNGILHGAASGSILVDMSTIAPGAARRIAAALGRRGIDMLDAPVSGGE